MFISRHTLKWTKTCRSSGDFPHAHTAHFLLNRHRPARFALAGREPRVASDLPADRGRMPSRHHGHAAHARPVAHPNPDDLPSLFRQVRIHLAQGATPLRLAIRTISNLTGAALSIRQRASHHAVIMLL